MSKFAKEVTLILSDIQRGDETRLKELIDITANHLCGVARLYLANKSLDEDVVAEAYVRATTYIDSFNPKKDGYNWLCKIVQRAAYDVNANEKRIAKAETKFALLQPKEYYESGFENIDFLMLLDGVDDIDRFILLEKFYAGRTLEDIGRSLNISKVAVYHRLARIYKKVKKNNKIS